MIHHSKINLAALVQIRRCTDSCGFRPQGCGRTRSQEATKRGGASYDPRGVCNLGGHPRTHSSPNARRSTELAKIGPPEIPHQAKKFPGGCRASPLAVGLVPDDRLPRFGAQWEHRPALPAWDFPLGHVVDRAAVLVQMWMAKHAFKLLLATCQALGPTNDPPQVLRAEYSGILRSSASRLLTKSIVKW